EQTKHRMWNERPMLPITMAEPFPRGSPHSVHFLLLLIVSILFSSILDRPLAVFSSSSIFFTIFSCSSDANS
ncbi:hypothetical protein PFISCL1PPCAC_10464, partial [Pristionchus fissidentatus]